MINEAGVRISFKELLLLKGIADVPEEASVKDADGTWVYDFSAARYVGKPALAVTLSKAVGNGLIEIDDSSKTDKVKIRLTTLGAKILKAAEPSYAAKLGEAIKTEKKASIPKLNDMFVGNFEQQAALDTARANSFEDFYVIAHRVTINRNLPDEELKKMMSLVRRGKKFYILMLDYSDMSGNFETALRRNALEKYEKQGFTLFAQEEDFNHDDFIFYK